MEFGAAEDDENMMLSPKALRLLVGCALLLSLAGTYLGLIDAPPDRLMGDVYRIFYVHVPCAWMALVAYTVTLVASIAYLFIPQPLTDAIAEAACEIGVLFNALTLATGAIWGRPTWGVWWAWDPRLTSAAVMLLLFAGVMGLRRVVTPPARAAAWAAVVAILAYVDIPVVWKSVQWYSSLHQLQSSPQTVAPPMVLALRVNAFAFLAITLAFLQVRVRLRLGQNSRAADAPPARPATAAALAGGQAQP